MPWLEVHSVIKTVLRRVRRIAQVDHHGGERRQKRCQFDTFGGRSGDDEVDDVGCDDGAQDLDHLLFSVAHNSLLLASSYQ